jgi:hypothetical protein
MVTARLMKRRFSPEQIELGACSRDLLIDKHDIARRPTLVIME